MRRKFIPPVLDLFNDIACWYKYEGDENYIFDERSSEELKEARSIVNYLHSISDCSESDSKIVQLKLDALLMSEEEMAYLYSVHNMDVIVPNVQQIVVNVIKQINDQLNPRKEKKTSSKEKKGNKGIVGLITNLILKDREDSKEDKVPGENEKAREKEQIIYLLLHF